MTQTFAGKQYGLPDPVLCPDCRKQRRLSFRNDFTLYRRTSSLSGKSMLSIYPENSPFPVYDLAEWWSDKWDPLSYGSEYDFNRGFFEQFAALRKRVPRQSLYVDSLCENCNYSNQLTMSKNCYLVFSGSSNEDCYYGNRMNNSKNCVDCLYCIESELCYECIDVSSSYGCKFCQVINNCSDSAFLFDCQNCHNCLFSIGLRNKSYYIFNEPHSKEEFTARLNALELNRRSRVEQCRQQFAEFIADFPRKYAYLKQVENVSGDNVQNSKNCESVFDGANLENVSFAQFVQDSKDCMDVNYCCDNTELHYEVATGGIDAYNVMFSIDVWPNVRSLLYCDSCSTGTKDCFGCIGLRAKQYCILNRQYAQQDYGVMVSRIIEQMQKDGAWGRFFPAALAPFAYNESTAQDYFPLTEPAARKLGYRWEAGAASANRPAEAAVPDGLQELDRDFSQTLLSCTNCSKNFKLTAQEIEFYQKQNLAPPETCFFCRHKSRMSKRNPRNLWKRRCDKCGIESLSTYSPQRKEQVYCETCYGDVLIT